jgi:predicted kinase
MDMLKTRHRENVMLQACLAGKQPCVIDNTNPTKEEREKYITEFKQHKFAVEGYFFDTPLQVCIARNELRTGKERIPDIGIKGTYKKLQLPSYNEGFNKLYRVSSTENEYVVSEWGSDEIQ